MQPSDYVTPEQQRNLARLAVFLHRGGAPRIRLNMRVYYACDAEGDAVTPEYVSECGTSCCAAGHGPLIGIRPLTGETWLSYVFRVFVDHQRAWSWMFGPEWVPDKEQAARRIALVASGQPISPDWLEGDPYVVPDVIDWNKLNDFAKNEPA